MLETILRIMFTQGRWNSTIRNKKTTHSTFCSTIIVLLFTFKKLGSIRNFHTSNLWMSKYLFIFKLSKIRQRFGDSETVKYIIFDNQILFKKDFLKGHQSLNLTFFYILFIFYQIIQNLIKSSLTINSLNLFVCILILK